MMRLMLGVRCMPPQPLLAACLPPPASPLATHTYLSPHEPLPPPTRVPPATRVAHGGSDREQHARVGPRCVRVHAPYSVSERAVPSARPHSAESWMARRVPETHHRHAAGPRAADGLAPRRHLRDPGPRPDEERLRLARRATRRRTPGIRDSGSARCRVPSP